MIFFWMREIAGWGLIAFSMIMTQAIFEFLSNRQVVEATVVGLVMLAFLKAGIQLIRVSTAARIALRK